MSEKIFPAGQRRRLPRRFLIFTAARELGRHLADAAGYDYYGSEILGVFVPLYFLLGKRKKYLY